MKKNNNHNTKSLSLFVIFLILVSFFTQTSQMTSKNFMNSSLRKLESNLLGKTNSKIFLEPISNPHVTQIGTNRYGFFCLPISKEGNSSAYSKLILTPIRVNLSGIVECFSIDGKTCMTAESSNCYNKLIANYRDYDKDFNNNISISENHSGEKPTISATDSKVNQLLACPIQKEKRIENFSWCNEAEKLLFRRWLCPGTTGLNVAVKISNYSGNISCLSRDGETCYTGELAQKACLKANTCTNKDLQKKIFQSLECGSQKFRDLYGNSGYDSKYNSWCRKAMSLFLNKQEVFYPIITNNSVIVKLNENGTPSCISDNAETCLKYSNKPSETERKYVEQVIEGKVYVTISCGAELKESKEATTGYETKDHWCKNFYPSIAVNLVQLQPLTKLTKSNIEELARELVQTKEILNDLNKEKEKILKKAEEAKKVMDKVTADEILGEDVIFVNKKTDLFLQEKSSLAKQEVILQEEAIRLLGEKLKFNEAHQELIEKEQALLKDLLKYEETADPTNQKRKDRIDLRNKELNEKLPLVLAEIKKISKQLTDALNVKADLEKALKKAETAIDDNKKALEEYIRLKKIEEEKYIKLMSKLPVLLKLPSDFKTSTDVVVDSKTVKVYPTNFNYYYSPILKDNEVAINILKNKEFLSNNTPEGAEQVIDLKPRLSAIPISTYEFNDKNKLVKKTKNVLDILESEKVDNPYARSFIELPYSTEQSPKNIEKKKKLDFFSNLGTQVNSGSIISLCNMDVNKCLKSYELFYNNPSTGSKQQEVSGGSHILLDSAIKNKKNKLDSFVLWELLDYKNSKQELRNGSLVKLRHIQTNRFLFSQPKFKSPASNRQEVSCYSGFVNFLEDSDNNNHLFKLEISFSLFKDGVFRVGDTFRLVHVATGKVLGMAEYLTPRTDQNEVFGFDLIEEDSISKISSRFVVTSSFSTEEEEPSTITQQRNFIQKPRQAVNPNPLWKTSNDNIIVNDISPAATSFPTKAEVAGNIIPKPKNGKKPFECLDNKPFCVNIMSHETNPNIAGMSLINSLRNVSFSKIGAPVSLNDKIKIMNASSGLYLTFSDERHSTGSYMEKVIGAKEDLKKSLFTYKFVSKDAKSKNSLFKLEISQDGIYVLRTDESFVIGASGETQVSMDATGTTDGNDIFEFVPLQKVVQDDEVRVGNTYFIKHKNSGCLLSISNSTIKNDYFKRSVVCSANPSVQNVFTITSNNNYVASKDYLNFVPEKISDGNDIVGFKEKESEDTLVKEIKDLKALIEELKRQKKITEKTKKENELKQKEQDYENLKKKISYYVFEATINKEKHTQQKITPSELPYPPSILKERNFEFLKKLVSESPVNPKASIVGKIISIKHSKTEAYLNKSDAQVSGTYSKDFGNLWKITESSFSKVDFPYVLTNYITGQNLKVITTFNKDYLKNYRLDSLVQTSGINGISNSNSIFQFCDENFKPIDPVKIDGTTQFMIKNVNRGCYLAFVPNRFTSSSETYYIPYCSQHTDNSLVPKTFFMFQAETILEDSDGVYPDIEVEKIVDLNPLYERPLINTELLPTRKPFGLNKVLYNKDTVKNYLRSLDFVEILLDSGKLKLQSHYSLLPGLNQQEVFLDKTEKDSNNNSWRIVGNGRTIEDGSYVKIIHYATGKCLSANKIKSSSLDSKSKDIEYLVYAIGENEICDSNSEWQIKKTSNMSLTTKDLEKKNVVELANLKKITYDDEIVLLHKNTNTYLSFFDNKTHFKSSDLASKIKSTVYFARTLLDKDEWKSSSVKIKLNYLGRVNTFEKIYNEYLLKDSYEKLTVASTKNSKDLIVLKGFEKKADYKDWNELKQNDEIVKKIGDFKEIMKIDKVVDNRELTSLYNLISNIKVEDKLKAEERFNAIGDTLKASEKSKIFEEIKPEKYTTTSKDFKTVESKKANDKKKIFNKITSEIAKEIKEAFETIKTEKATSKQKIFETIKTEKASQKNKIFETIKTDKASAMTKLFEQIKLDSVAKQDKSFETITALPKNANYKNFLTPTNTPIPETLGNFALPVTQTRSGNGSFSEPVLQTRSGNGSFSEPVLQTRNSKGSFSEPVLQTRNSKGSFSEPVAQTRNSKGSFSEPVAQTRNSVGSFKEPVVQSRSGVGSFKEPTVTNRGNSSSNFNYNEIKRSETLGSFKKVA